jgi:cephalosporin-C deacetylase-like acetyl esterase
VIDFTSEAPATHDLKIWLQIVVAFRGTEPDSKKDLLCDLNFAHAQGFHVHEDIRSKVHAGFNGAVQVVTPKIAKIISMCMGSDEPSSWKVSVTGHSLGGALASLFAYHLQLSWCASSCPCFASRRMQQVCDMNCATCV